MSDPLPAPNFNLAYDVKPTDIGAGYAAGITSAGQSIAGAITGLMGGTNAKTGEYEPGIFGQNRSADETLAAMKQSGMMTEDQYNAVAGKSLTTKQAMTGMFANQWIADQATKRALALEQGKGQVETDVMMQKLQATIDAVRKGYGIAVGVKPGELPVTPNNPANQVPPQNLGQQPTLGSGSAVAAGAGQTTVPTLASQVKPTDKLIIGSPIDPKDTIPSGAKIGWVHGQRGVQLPDGQTFRPFK